MKALDPGPATLTPPPTDGVVGVSGNEPSREDGDSRLVALLIGRNIPAPAFDVAK